jgi:hypothetical protein
MMTAFDAFAEFVPHHNADARVGADHDEHQLAVRTRDIASRDPDRRLDLSTAL